MAIRGHYQEVIGAIADARGIKREVVPPSYDISRQSTLERVLQYTEYYAGGGREARWAGGNPHYRYDRYRGALARIDLPTIDSRRRLAHVDIGCGAGLFAWALLDWALGRGIRYSNISLYGYDYSKEMVRLARMMRTRLAQYVSSYPVSRYSSDPNRLLRNLASNHQSGTVYLITFGYVLAGNQYDSDIASFRANCRSYL